jgi:hypothetical protein
MKINYHNSDLMTLNVDPANVNLFAQIFSCSAGNFPFKYLSVPLHYGKLAKEDIQPIVDKTFKKFGGWRGKLLNYEGKLILLKACIASIPMYLLLVIKVPKWAIRIINTHMDHFLWND